MISSFLHDLFVKSPLLGVPILGLALFLVTFVVILVVTYRRSAKSYDEVARLPLQEDRRE